MTWLAELPMENVLVLKLTSKQKQGLITAGAVCGGLVFFSYVSPGGPPDSPGFDAMDAYNLLFAGGGIVMILLGLFAPTKDDTPDVKQ